MANTKTVNLTEIHRPADLQMRESLRTEHINEMAEALQNGDELPPVRVVQEGKTFWLWDGHHRVAAHETAGIRKVEIEVTEQGGRKRARWLAYSANRDNTALKRSLEDRRKAVRAALQDAWDWSDRAIAEHVGVGRTMVASLREEAGGTNATKQASPGRTGKDGKQYPAKKKSAKKKTAKSGPQGGDDGYEEEAEGEPEPEPEPEQPASNSKSANGKEQFGPKDRKAAREHLRKFIETTSKAPDYDQVVRPRTDVLWKWVKGEKVK